MRNPRRLYDSATFWLAVGAIVTVLAALPGAVGIAEVQPHWADLWSNGWFRLAIGGELLGITALCWSLILFMAHRHVEWHQRHACPDHQAHQTTAINAASATASEPALSAGLFAKQQPGQVIATPRVMCALGPLGLTQLFSRGATDVQGESLVAKYRGQWREVSATVAQVKVEFEALTSASGKDSDQVWVDFFFDPNVWGDRLHALAPGDPITVLGQVRRVTKVQVIFDGCELRPTTGQPQPQATP